MYQVLLEREMTIALALQKQDADSEHQKRHQQENQAEYGFHPERNASLGVRVVACFGEHD